jgi:hypothetical protein
MQSLAFSGDKWMHCHGIQGGIGPDGMLYHWHDGPTGCNPDLTFLRDSRLNWKMQVCLSFRYVCC